jgi:phosphohistidine phosphatase SixA
MLAILLTHADAHRVERTRFRALSDQGRAQVDETAARFRTIIAKPDLDLSSDQLAIREIISSPLARCVETALRFSDAIKDFTETSEIRVRDRLREQRAGQLTAGDLVSVLDDISSPAALICTHGDLAGALPMSAALKPQYNTNGWFEGVRPVLVLVKYERGSEWNSANVLCCESPANYWETLMEN